VSGNTFRTFAGNIDGVEFIDNSIADLDYTLSRNVLFEGNTFNGINQPTINPVTLEFDQMTDASTWTLNVADYLPFGGNARTVSSVIAKGDITNAASQTTYNFPSVVTNAGASNDLVQLKWPETCKGKVVVTARMDNPV